MRMLGSMAMLGLFVAVGTAAPWTPARAQAATCTANASDKKLAGAAKTSFLKKCGSDAAKTCDASAAEKKLRGAAKTSFTKKCTADAVGT